MPDRLIETSPGQGDTFVAVDRQWRIRYVHGAGLRALGLSLEEAVGRDLWETFPVYRGTRSEEIARRVMAGGEPARTEIVGLLTGRWFEVSVYPTGDGLCLYGYDVTERKLAEQDVRRSEQRYRVLAETVSSAVWSWDPVNNLGDFAATQAWWNEITGQPPAEQAGTGWLDAIHPDDRGKAQSAWERAMETGEPYEVEYRLLALDGSVRMMLSRAAAVREPDGTVREWIGMLSDITESWRAGEALREADRRKDEFLAILAHELRNPLAPIRSSAEILRRLGSTDPQVERAVRRIDRQASHMVRLVDDLLDLSRISRGKILLREERVDLVALARTTAEDHHALFEDAGITLATELPEEAVWVQGDATRLSQILGNLLQNARKFTDQGGHVTVRLETGSEAGRVLLKVEDSGIGMAPEMLARLFEPFSQADRSLDRSRGGLGLGLALAKGLAALHGGGVEAASAGVGQGSCFTVSLPSLTETGADSIAEAPAESPASPLHVLVIEDHPDAAESLKMLLEITGHRVDLAADGRAGLDAACRLRPDVVICDIGLPGMNGYAVAQALRESEETGGAYLVALTGYGQVEDRRRAQEAGFDRHLTKPVDFDTMASLLDGVPRRAR
ncbi:MAG TPA: ATP-binding protein [Thermoanaerobaculia bacterium]|nr:ATP-binding protein [Thermoanaerobaculia bacterium]